MLYSQTFQVRCNSNRRLGIGGSASSVTTDHSDMCPLASSESVLTDQQRAKQNSGPDQAFYREPRFVQHVDDRFRERLTQLYREQLVPGSRILDLMSSWGSHLPEDIAFEEVIGHGMNEEELAANEQLADFFLQDLNADSQLPLHDETFDATLCAVSVQYLQHPETVFAETARVLRPGGVFMVTFSNRMFTQKAIQAWRDGSGPDRRRLVKKYFGAVDAFGEPQSITENPSAPPRERLLGGAPDPFYAVWARKTDRNPSDET